MDIVQNIGKNSIDFMDIVMLKLY